MNLFYLLSVVGTRFFNLLMVVVLSYVLSAGDFGRFTLVMTNALLLHLVVMGWLSSSLWRDASQAAQGDAAAAALALRLGVLFAAGFLVVGALALAFAPPSSRYLAFIPLLAPLLLFNELLLIAFNARHADRSYSLLSFLRGLFCLALAVALIGLGWGLWGALAAQLLGIVLAIALIPDARALLSAARGMTGLPRDMPEKLRFGLISVASLNIYMLANTLCRNVIALRMDEAHAGYFSLAADMFYAPVALFATSLSLSSIPDLYRQSSGAVDAPAASREAGRFILSNLAVALPYAVGAVFVAQGLTALLLADDTAAAVGPIAAMGAIQGSAFALLSALTTLALTRGRVKLSLLLSLGTLAVVAGATLGADTALPAISAATTVAITVCAVLAFLLALAQSMARVPVPSLLKIMAASGAMLPALYASTYLPAGVLAVVGAIIAGGISYVVAGWLVGSDEIKALLRLHRAPTAAAASMETTG